jgi:hypothetical protein
MAMTLSKVQVSRWMLATVVAASMATTGGIFVIEANATFAPQDADKSGVTGERAPPRLDIFGDPLPNGAVARLGTARRRVLARDIQFTKDSKQLIDVAVGKKVHIWNADTGRLAETRLLEGRPERDDRSVMTVMSPDSQTALIADRTSLPAGGARGVTPGSDVSLSDRTALELWDLASCKRIDVPMPKDLKRVEESVVADDRRQIFLIETVAYRVPLPKGDGIGSSAIAFDRVQNLISWDTKTG